jgi:hypothetical protein
MRVRELKTGRVIASKITGHGTGNVETEAPMALAAEAVDGVSHLLKDSSGQSLLATGTTVPSDTDTLYAKGCLFIDTDVTSGTSGLYVNVGTSASCIFKLVTNAA